MTQTKLDPIGLEVFQESLVAAVAEMRVTVLRTAFSSIIYEGQDFSCALTDGRGRLTAISREDAPVHVGPMNLQVPAAVEKFRGNLAPGDVLLANDPYTSGTHLNDVLVMAPFFAGGKPLFISCIRAHWGDIGGMTPGSISGRSTEIFQEGVRIPIIKLYDAGKPNEAALELLFANVRQPRDRRGDFFAQLAAARTAEDRFESIVKRFGVDTAEAAIDQILDRTEARMRAQIATLPKGEYSFEDYMDSDGNDPDPVRIRVRVAVGSAGLEVDFTGSSPQRSGPVNASLAVASTSVFVALKALLDPSGHINEGAFRPVKITAPEGSVVNASYPAPMGGFTEIYKRVSGTLVGALSRCAPARVAGDIKGTANHVYIGFLGDRGVKSIFYEYASGGTGAFLASDGSNSVREWDTGDFSSIQSTELVEHEHECIVERCELREDSGGPGLRRGGLGMRRVIRIESDQALFSVLSDRNVFPPYGVVGGGPARANRAYLLRDDEVLEPSPSLGKVSGFPLRAGDKIVLLTAGGGGYGDPFERSPDLVASDVASGLVTESNARNQYGIVLAGGHVAIEETDALRSSLKKNRLQLRLCSWTSDDEPGIVQVFRIHPQTATRAGLADDALVELSTGEGAPLRGRVRTTAAVDEASVALTPGSLAMLGVGANAPVHVSALLAPALA